MGRYVVWVAWAVCMRALATHHDLRPGLPGQRPGLGVRAAAARGQHHLALASGGVPLRHGALGPAPAVPGAPAGYRGGSTGRRPGLCVACGVVCGVHICDDHVGVGIGSPVAGEEVL